MGTITGPPQDKDTDTRMKVTRRSAVVAAIVLAALGLLIAGSATVLLASQADGPPTVTLSSPPATVTVGTPVRLTVELANSDGGTAVTAPVLLNISAATAVGGVSPSDTGLSVTVDGARIPVATTTGTLLGPGPAPDGLVWTAGSWQLDRVTLQPGERRLLTATVTIVDGAPFVGGIGFGAQFGTVVSTTSAAHVTGIVGLPAAVAAPAGHVPGITFAGCHGTAPHVCTFTTDVVGASTPLPEVTWRLDGLMVPGTTATVTYDGRSRTGQAALFEQAMMADPGGTQAGTVTVGLFTVPPGRSTATVTLTYPHQVADPTVQVSLVGAQGILSAPNMSLRLAQRQALVPSRRAEAGG